MKKGEDSDLSDKMVIYREQYADLPARFVKKIDHDLEYLADREIPGLQKVYLFGSCARGEVRSTSDVDLLVVTREKLQDRMLAADIRWTLDEEIDGVRTDIVYGNLRTAEEGITFQRELKRDRKLVMEAVK